MSKVDYLVVGAGFAGLVFAERVCTQLGKTCLIVDRRGHIGGNSHDEYDQNGVLYHKYGPHYFRTNSPRVRAYLSQFTDWIPCEYKVLSYTNGRHWSFPINLSTYEQIIGRASTEEEFVAWLTKTKVQLKEIRNSEELILSQVGSELYQQFFKNYTKKQWGISARELDPSVCGRIPIRTTRDDRYFSDEFQALPKQGYHTMFNRIVERCGDRLRVSLNTDYMQIGREVKYEFLVYTGPIDEYFSWRFGPLPYRSLRFEMESFKETDLLTRVEISGKPGFWQRALQVNFPNDNDYTRIVELKHATGQATPHTAIVKEYPADYHAGGEPYYPVPTKQSADQYKHYEKIAKEAQNTIFIGRLATYRYYNMDQVVGMALAEFERHRN